MENLDVTVQSVLDQERLRWPQFSVYVLCFLVTLVDGFDTQVIAFTGPVIMKVLGISRADLSYVFMAGTIGMALGAMGFGLAADRFGRRPLAILAVFVFSVFTVAVAATSTFHQLLLLRLLAGLGIGGATPVVVALTSEYAPSRVRAVVISCMISGLPIGAVVGALLAKQWLPLIGWQAVYLYGGIAAFVVMLLCALFMPESAQLLVARGREADQPRARKLLQRFLKHELPPNYRLVPQVKVERVSVSALLAPDYRLITLGIWGSFLFNYLAWFMLIFWLPTVLVDSGLPQTSAPLGTLTVNIVAIIGLFPTAFLIQKVPDVRAFVMALFVFGILVCVALAFTTGPEKLIFVLVGLAGIGLGLEQMGLYYLAANLYPAKLRAAGVGWGVGMGRVGTIFGGGLGSFFLHGNGVTSFYLGLIPPLILAMGAVLLIPKYTRTTPVGDLP